MTRRLHNFTSADKRAIKEAAKHRCQKCGCDLRHKAWVADHIIPVAMGGRSEPSNGQALCLDCDKIKTAADVGRIRKADRAATRHMGIKPQSKFRRAVRPVDAPDAKVNRQAAKFAEHKAKMQAKGKRP